MAATPDVLGSFEQLVLGALLQLGDEAYGVSVRREIQSRTGRDVSIGAVYATLERLEAKGLVSSLTGEATSQRGGRAKRYFKLTMEGQRALRQSVGALLRMLKGLKLDWRTE